MCAAITSTLLLVFTILCSTTLVIEGLPYTRRERDFQDIIAGADFLSLLMESNRIYTYRETTTMPLPLPSITETEFTPHIRQTRSTSYLGMSLPKMQTEEPEEFGRKIYASTTERSFSDSSNEQSSDYNLSREVERIELTSNNGRDLLLVTAEATTEAEDNRTTRTNQQILVPSEERPSLIAEASKSDFSVDESEPITSNGELPSEDYAQGYPANVQVLPNAQSIPSFHERIPDEVKEKLQPLHETVIYHNDPHESGQARSVSYSTVIQSLPQQPQQDYHYGRQERHYGSSQESQANNYGKSEMKRNQSKPAQSSMAESNDYYVTSKYNPIEFNENTEKSMNQPWKKPEEAYQATASSKNLEPPERNWGVPEKPYIPPTARTTARIPIIYGQPEKNYEVDESVSVMTNGRTHGVQRTQPPTLIDKTKQKKIDDNQKVGYVVEGRNYRKYRVEERTPDGFIVGEYGVVSHDDGSLRGVRYTADGTINPRLIYDALMKFLSL